MTRAPLLPLLSPGIKGVHHHTYHFSSFLPILLIFILIRHFFLCHFEVSGSIYPSMYTHSVRSSAPTAFWCLCFDSFISYSTFLSSRLLLANGLFDPVSRPHLDWHDIKSTPTTNSTAPHAYFYCSIFLLSIYLKHKNMSSRQDIFGCNIGIWWSFLFSLYALTFNATVARATFLPALFSYGFSICPSVIYPCVFTTLHVLTTWKYFSYSIFTLIMASNCLL